MKAILFRFSKGVIGTIFFSIILSTLTILSVIGLMGTSAYLIVMAGFHPSIAALQVLIVGVRFFGISRSVFRYFERLFSHSANLKILSNIRQYIFKEISENYPFLLPGKSSALILGFLIQDIDMLENVFVRILLPILSSFLVTIIVSIFLGVFSSELVFVVFFGFIVIGVILSTVSAITGSRLSQKQNDFRNEYQGNLLDFFQFFQEYLVYFDYKKIAQKLEIKEEKYNRNQWQSGVIQSLFSAFNNMMIQFVALICIWVSIYFLKENQIELILIAIFYLIILTMFESLQNVPATAFSAGNFNNTIGRLNLISEKGDAARTTNKREIDEILPIRIQNLNFQYHSRETNTLRNINLEIRNGEKIAIVGSNGSGKTTFLDLLAGFYYSYKGEIYCKDFELRDLNLDAYRTHLSYMLRNPYVFSTSLLQNLKLANPNVKAEEISVAIQKVKLDSRFAYQEDQIILEKGKNISSGEIQKIELTRSLLRENDLILLDEPLSNLDPILSRMLNNLIRNEFGNKTILWVTHELTDMEWFDKILVFENGEIIEQGSHTDLLSRPSVYRELAENKNYV
ncbi:MAG: thiol reductant ABC exporter subunit CydC [Anaerolineaceae bacterium]